MHGYLRVRFRPIPSFTPREHNMPKAFRYSAAAVVLAMVTAIAPSTAQFLPTPGAQQTSPPVEKPKGKKAALSPDPSITGSWVGTLTQVGNETPYQFEMAITTNSVETKYPDLDCTGKLTRVGSFKSYVYFFEVITKGRADKGGRCPDGTITVAPQGKDLAVGWFGNVQDTTVVAYGTLNKK